MARYCLVDPAGGPLKVTLSANNGVRVGGKFALRKENADLEAWDAATGDRGSTTHEMETAPRDTLHLALQWRLLCCSFIPGADSARIAVEVVQDGVPCPMTKPAQWEPTVPPCDSDQQRPIVASLVFAERPRVPTEPS
jgi:hypothetical protein